MEWFNSTPLNLFIYGNCEAEWINKRHRITKYKNTKKHKKHKNDSRYYINFELPSELLAKRKDKFIDKFMASQSLLDYFAIQ